MKRLGHLTANRNLEWSHRSPGDVQSAAAALSFHLELLDALTEPSHLGVLISGHSVAAIAAV